MDEKYQSESDTTFVNTTIDGGHRSLILLVPLVLVAFLLVEGNLVRAFLNGILAPGSAGDQVSATMQPGLKESALVCVVVSALTVLIAMLTWQDLPSLRHRALASVLFSYVCLFVYFGAQPGIPPLMPYYETAVRLWSVLAGVAILGVCATWTGTVGRLPSSWRQIGIVLAVAAGAAAPLGELENIWTGAITGVLIIPLFAISVFWLIRHAMGGLGQAVEATVIASSLVWVGQFVVRIHVDRDINIWNQLEIFGPIPFLVLASGSFALALYRRNPDEKEDLAVVIEKQRRALEEQRERLDDAKRTRVLLEERGRLTRDVHDGIGSQITSLIIRVRNNSVDPKELEAELQTGLQDLRLIVDSLELENTDFVQAMHAFHSRIAPQLQAAQIRLNWSMDAEALENIEFGPQEILNVFRFLQEAVANVIRHSGADHLDMHIRRAGKDGKLEIFLQDNGVGFEPEDIQAGNGKGLSNMEKRAARLDGKLHIASGGAKPGTRILLTIDIPPNAMKQ